MIHWLLLVIGWELHGDVGLDGKGTVSEVCNH